MCVPITRAIDIGLAGGERTRFLGSHRRDEVLAALEADAVTAAKPASLDTRRLLMLGLGAFLLLVILILLAKRRKRT
jgi:hypothetical protein